MEKERKDEDGENQRNHFLQFWGLQYCTVGTVSPSPAQGRFTPHKIVRLYTVLYLYICISVHLYICIQVGTVQRLLNFDVEGCNVERYCYGIVVPLVLCCIPSLTIKIYSNVGHLTVFDFPRRVRDRG